MRDKGTVFELVALGLVAFGGRGEALPVRNIPDLTSIAFYERSGGVAPTPYTFGVGSPQLTTRLGDPLGAANMDFQGVATEFYTVST